MDTRLLETFLMVVETGSLSEAGRRLSLTPAGVTQRLRSLEADIGVQLLSRAGRGVTPTPAGQRLAERAAPVLHSLHDMIAGLDEDVLAGELRLGAITTAAVGLLPDLLVALRDSHPGIVVRLKPGRPSELYASISDGSLDAAIIVEPMFGLPKSFGWQKARDELLVLMVPSTMQKDDPVELLRSQPFIRFDRRSWGGKLADDYLRDRHIRPREVFELETLDAIAVLVDRGLGISVVPDWSPLWPSGLAVAKLPLQEAPCRTIGLVWQRSSPRKSLIAAVATLLTSQTS